MSVPSALSQNNQTFSDACYLSLHPYRISWTSLQNPLAWRRNMRYPIPIQLTYFTELSLSSLFGGSPKSLDAFVFRAAPSAPSWVSCVSYSPYRYIPGTAAQQQQLGTMLVAKYFFKAPKGEQKSGFSAPICTRILTSFGGSSNHCVGAKHGGGI